MYENKTSMDKNSLGVSSIKKQQGLEGDKLVISNKVRCPVLTPLERLAADLAWNG